MSDPKDSSSSFCKVLLQCSKSENWLRFHLYFSCLCSGISTVIVNYFCSMKWQIACTLKRGIFDGHKVTDFQRDPFRKFLWLLISPDLMSQGSLNAGQSRTKLELGKEQGLWQNYDSMFLKGTTYTSFLKAEVVSSYLYCQCHLTCLDFT